jgi:hypothetical protein
VALLGNLLTDTVLRTAGHCADLGEGAVSARIDFEQDAGVNYDPELGHQPAVETTIVAAITITGDAMCRATNVDDRLDTPSARAFLGHQVTQPEPQVNRSQPPAAANWNLVAAHRRPARRGLDPDTTA